MASLTPLPSKLKIAVYRHVFGFDVAADARIGFSLITCSNLSVGSGAGIGHMNVIKGNMALRMGARSSIGQFNWITGGNTDPRYFRDFERSSELVLGDDSSITSRHIFDCTDSVEIGNFTTIAGYRSSIITHGIDYRASQQSCGGIKIGDRCLIGSNSVILMGVSLADRSIVAAGSVLTKSTDSELGLWAGVPARRTKDLTGEEGYFRRENGHIY
ncbi:DapH/DapD/GlmU-related protein [Bradyrhizobium sp. MOS002]|uniref:acyltransferase n=1 Tax=Bradyrhizobium sp. MOS002 TaxID=2133947 RepID=UPI000D12B3C4|nr:acyltransferase [Bradyrhizobium sp. MOS002]PSO25967.1 hypothetical protein C7G41_28725 [Bradyrhizobium sp. MOS002]